MLESRMSQVISPETERQLAEEARKNGISIDDLLASLLRERQEGSVPLPVQELPVWRLGVKGSLSRRDIYSDLV